MAVPTIVSISPATGLSKGGYLIAINGTNFQVPTVPASGSGYLGDDATPTCKVTIGGVDCEYAEPATSALIYCKVPEWIGSPSVALPLSVDVVVSNIDSNGDVVLFGGVTPETVTLVDGFAYDRPSLAAECYLKRAIDSLILLIRRHVITNVAVTLSREYDDDPATVERLRDSAPSVHLVGPRTVLNRFYSLNRCDTEYTDPADEGAVTAVDVHRRSVPVTMDLDFDVRIWATNPYHSTNLVQAFVLLFRDATELKVLIDPDQPDLGYHDYEIEIDWGRYPSMDAAPNYSDLSSATFGLVVRGVHLDDESGTILERGMNIWANEGYPVSESETL